MENGINGRKVISLKLNRDMEMDLEEKIRKMWNILIVTGIVCVSILARFYT